MMKKGIFLLMTALFTTTALADPVPPRLMKNIVPLHIMKAGLQNGVLKLTTSHSTITHEIYREIIETGACSVLIAHPEKGWGKAYIERIEVLNKSGSQGYVLANARKTCLEMGEIEGSQKQEAYLVAHTHEFIP